jgi:hypothetical protein
MSRPSHITPPKYMRVDVDIVDNYKVDELLETKGGATAFVAYIALLGWAVENLSDGYLPARAVRLVRRASPALMRQLVTAGLIDVYGDGWVIPDFLEYQKAASEWIATGEARSKGGAKGNCRRHHDDSCRCLEGHPPTYREATVRPIGQAIAQAITQAVERE